MNQEDMNILILIEAYDHARDHPNEPLINELYIKCLLGLNEVENKDPYPHMKKG